MKRAKLDKILDDQVLKMYKFKFVVLFYSHIAYKKMFRRHSGDFAWFSIKVVVKLCHVFLTLNTQLI